MFNELPDQLNLLKKLQESTTNDIDEDKGFFQKGDHALYQMFESGLSKSDLIRMLGHDEFALRFNHNKSIATIAEAIGDDISRYSIIFEDGFIVNDATPDELLFVSESKVEEEEKIDEETVRQEYVDKCVKVFDSPKGTVQQKIAYMKQKGATDDEITQALNTASGGELVKSALESKESKVEEVLGESIIEAKEFTCASCGKKCPTEDLFKSRGNKNYCKAAKCKAVWVKNKSVDEKTKDIPEKPKIEAEEVGMEDMSEEDLEKAKSKSADSGNAIIQVDDKEVENEELPKPSKEQNVSEGIQDIDDEQLRTLYNNTRKSYDHWKNDKSQPERASQVKAQLDAYENELDRRRNESTNESKFPFMINRKPLWLCNECFVTFRSNSGVCMKCGAKLTEKIFEGKDSDLASGETKEVFKVTWKNKETGKEESTSVMAYDKTAAEKEAKRPSREDVKAEGPIMSEPKDEGINNPGRRDGTGPAKGSAQRSVSKVGRRKQAGEKCPKGDDVPFESKLKEGVQELIGEVPGIDKDEQEALRKAIEDGIISNEWPSDEEMVDALTKAGVDSVIANDPELEDFRLAYLKHVLLTLATKSHLAAKESNVSEEEELYLGAPVKILRGRLKGQIGELADIQTPDEDPDGKGQLDIQLTDGRIIYVEWDDVELVSSQSSNNDNKEEELQEANNDWDLTFKYKHNLIQHNPLENRNNETVLPYVISGKKVRVFSNYQAEWVERNKGIPVREIIIKEDRTSKSSAQLKKDTEISIVVEIAVSKIDSEVYNLSIIELPSGDKIIVDTDSDKDELNKRGKALARQLRAQFVGVVSEEKDHEDQIDGGLADKKQPEDFDAEQLEMGVKVEMEHTDDPAIAREIAMDHLKEHPNYYDSLKKMEDELELQNEEVSVETELKNRIIAKYKEARKNQKSREEAVQIATNISKDVDAPMVRRLLGIEGVREQEEDRFSTVAKALEEEDAKKMAIEKNGQVVADEENEKKFAVIVKDE